MKTIRDFINLLEAPVNDYETHGDFTKDGTLMGKDRKLVGSPKHEVRIKKLLNKTPFKINIYIVNLDETNKLKIRPLDNEDNDLLINVNDLTNGTLNTGQYSPERVKEYLGFNVRKDSRAINFILGGNNQGDDALSAWMIVHRFMHAIEDASGSRNQHTKADNEVTSCYHAFMRLLADYGMDSYVKDQLSTRSAENMDDAYEAIAETMTQYLVKGRVTLRNAKKAGDLEDQINFALEDLFHACLGKTFVIF